MKDQYYLSWRCFSIALFYCYRCSVIPPFLTSFSSNLGPKITWPCRCCKFVPYNQTSNKCCAFLIFTQKLVFWHLGEMPFLPDKKNPVRSRFLQGLLNLGLLQLYHIFTSLTLSSLFILGPWTFMCQWWNDILLYHIAWHHILPNWLEFSPYVFHLVGSYPTFWLAGIFIFFWSFYDFIYFFWYIFYCSVML